jgi:surface protein
MFHDAHAFNQSLAAWNVSNVTNMSHMFHDAQAFNQSLDTWNMQHAPTIDEMFSRTFALTNLPYGWLLDARSSFPTDRAMNMRAKDVFQGNPVFEKWFHNTPPYNNPQSNKQSSPSKC